MKKNEDTTGYLALILFCICAGTFVLVSILGKTDVWGQSLATLAWLSAIVLPVIFLLTKIYFAVAYRESGPPADRK